MSRFSDSDLKWMQTALALARRGEGLTRPNPPVGAVVVKNNRILGQGWHRQAGGPHAEIHALRQAGPRAKGATLYVTLEPCSTFGRTPPCTTAIQQAGIARVVVGAADPNPRHAGKGLRVLRQGGIQVLTGVGGPEARELIAPFACQVVRHRPFFTLKLGVSLDGRLADFRHHSRWITGPDASREVQAMRRRADAILVGAGTVRHDNPSLWPRPDRQRNPWRIIVVRDRPLPAAAQVFRDVHADRTILAAPRGWHPGGARRLRAANVKVLELPRRGFFPALAKELGDLGILRVLCEGGGIVAGELLRARLVDELCLFISPKLIGGPVGAVGTRHWMLESAPGFRIRDVRRIGPDLFVHLFPKARED